AIVEERHGHTPGRRMRAPREGARDRVDPPRISVAVAAVVRGRVVDSLRGHKRGARKRPACELAVRWRGSWRGLRERDARRERETSGEKRTRAIPDHAPL